jgi:Uma2 family endonuclease
MLHAAPPRKCLTVEDYLELEELSLERHEFIGGELFTRAAASERHNRIALNIASHLATAAEDDACRVLVADMKLQVAEDVIYYPDIMVVGDHDDTHPTVNTRPWLIVEIVSPATEATDQREKVLSYCRLPSLGVYLIVAQDTRHVVRHWRDGKGAWWREALVGEGSMRLTRPPTELQFGQIYKGIDFTAE